MLFFPVAPSASLFGFVPWSYIRSSTAQDSNDDNSNLDNSHPPLVQHYYTALRRALPLRSRQLRLGLVKWPMADDATRVSVNDTSPIGSSYRDRTTLVTFPPSWLLARSFAEA